MPQSAADMVLREAGRDPRGRRPERRRAAPSTRPSRPSASCPCSRLHEEAAGPAGAGYRPSVLRTGREDRRGGPARRDAVRRPEGPSEGDPRRQDASVRCCRATSSGSCRRSTAARGRRRSRPRPRSTVLRLFRRTLVGALKEEPRLAIKLLDGMAGADPTGRARRRAERSGYGPKANASNRSSVAASSVEIAGLRVRPDVRGVAAAHDRRRSRPAGAGSRRATSSARLDPELRPRPAASPR